ncbi:hypothetical protein AURDEDRAFT_136013 [Auricularia subglabra TFB-10046 SS5]|nr:hypothetical protein AURDEDRAFT_136013 [Auricularia subglabra TFB-10046 SS5]
MPSAKVVALCQSKDTLTGAVAASPTRPIGQVGKTLYEKTGTLRRISNSVSSKPIEKDPVPTPEDLDAAEKCGRFPYRPSDLFLKIFHDSLRCLERDPFVGCCSPPLLGSSGVIPVTVISIIPDIMRHYANVILTAESEIFLATNFLQKSRSLTLINNALRQLSKKVGERGGKKIVVKFMYDRGTAEQLVHNHAPVKPQDWWKVDLPPANDIPNIDMEVVNYHRPLLGTFHCKFMVVDRRAALISSNNIQDRANLEMMMHLEGPIVEGFYDMSLWCWSNAMKPMLPLVTQPATHTGHFSFGPDNPYLKDIDLEEAAVVARQDLKRQHTELIPKLEAADTHTALHRATGVSDSVENIVDGQTSKLRTVPPLVQDRLGHIGGGRLSEAVHNVLGHVRYQNEGNTQDVSGGTLRAGAVMEDVNAATLVFARTGAAATVEPVSPGEVQRLTDESAEIDKKEREEMNRPQEGKPNPWRDFEEEVKKDKAQAGAERSDRPTESEATKCIPGEKVGTTPEDHHERTPIQHRSESTDDHPSTDTRSSSRSQSSGSTAPTEHTQDAESGPGVAAPVPPAEVNVETAKATARDPAPSQPHQPPRDAVALLDINPEDGSMPHVHPEQEHETFDGLDHSRDSSGWSSRDHRSSSVGRRSFRSFRSKHSRHGSVAALTDHLNTGGGAGAEAGVEDTYDVQDFSPFVVHSEHKPFPIALVNRPAHGMPGHEDILTPQNVAWLAGFKYAQRKVFIQTPTLNASPIVAAIIEACKRGIEVILWLNLGFNDAGEMIPFQGGTNEEVVTRLYKALNPIGKGANLKVFWYVGKDQCVPLNAAVKKRNCHIKFMAIDDEVGIAGNGNQDTQSWFHSQEANVMVDSAQVVAEWMEALQANQNTGLYGRVDQEGVWRYEDGRPLEHLNLMKGTGPFGRIKGFVGAFQRATGRKPIK